MTKKTMVQQISAEGALTSIRNTHFSVNLTFNMPQQTKLDRSAQAEVESNRNAHDGYKVRKRLWAKSTIDPFNAIASQARNFLRARTVPMGDVQLLPKALMFDVLDTLENHYFVQWNQAKTVFAQDYAKVLREAEQAQGTGFDETVYPDVSEVVNQFTCDLGLLPVGDVGGGIFDDLEGDLKQQVADRVEATTMRNVRTALADPLARLVDAMLNIHNKTSREKSRIHPSMMGELETITSLIPALNVVGLPKLNELAAKCREELLVPTEELGGDTSQRERVAEQSEAMLKTLGVNTINNVNNNSATDRKNTARETADNILAQMKGVW